MVLLNGSRFARQSNSIIYRQNICGGPKKQGVAPKVGWFLQSNPNLLGAAQRLPIKCITTVEHEPQRYGYRATLGG